MRCADPLSCKFASSSFQDICNFYIEKKQNSSQNKKVISNVIKILSLLGFTPFTVVIWLSSSALVSINEVNLRWARLVLGWVTVLGFNSTVPDIYLVI